MTEPSRGLSHAARVHRDTRRRVLAQHPEIRQWMGPDASGLVGLAVLIALHVTTAWWVGAQSLGWIFVVAFTWGQLVLHSGGALVHEAAHGLILGGRRGRWVVDLSLEVLLTSFAHHVQYQLDHLRSHHPYLGDYFRDYEHKDAYRLWARAQLRAQRPWADRALRALHLGLDLLPLGFLVSDDLVEVLERRWTGAVTSDPRREVPRPRVPTGRAWACGVVSLLTLVGVTVLTGWGGLLYWVWSLSLFQGRWALSNTGQVITEHPTGDPDDPTRSTYGLWNWVLFNTGYHDEHHTFPRVGWRALPRLRAVAPEAFHAGSWSYAGAWARYVFGRTPRRPSAELDRVLVEGPDSARVEAEPAA